ncbi:MAG: hypothetical protein M0Z31_06175 [Clostridia bacterium]|nr:hypothetical protein [Clostridia bacterium]
MKKGLLLLGVIFLIVSGYYAYAGISAALNPPQPVDPAALTKRSDAASVTADITFRNPIDKAGKEELIFEVAFNTHSVPLENYDIANSVILKNDQGKEVATGFAWEPSSEASHHRTGILKIKNDGLLTGDTSSLTMILKDLAGVPTREFKWEGDTLKY